MPLISCKNVSLGYDGRIIVSGLNFDVNDGNYLCVVGENGSGKSTLMKVLLGLKHPAYGSVAYGDGLKKNEIGFLPQQTVIQKDFPASVREVVLSGCLNRHKFGTFYTKKDKNDAAENMRKLGIDQIGDRCFRELSGGQQQRVMLARALCATRRLLVLDEPVTGLDPIVTKELYEIIEKLNREDGKTVIMISHDIGAAVKYATHILHIGHEPLFSGTRDEYLKSDVGRVYSGADGTGGASD